jgi:RNA polymerase sigma factor (sigma-70 family)
MTAWNNSVSLPFPGQLSGRSEEPRLVRSVRSTLPDDEARRLVAAVSRGDEAAFQNVYDTYHGRLFRFALVLSHGDETLASDSVQATFVLAAARLQRVESEPHLWHWLARVARQQLSKARRQQGSSLPLVELAEADMRKAVTAAAGNWDADLTLEQQLDAALQSLDPPDRQLVEWFYFDGLSHKEMAAELKTTPKSVSSRLERARSRLKARVSQALSHEA